MTVRTIHLLRSRPAGVPDCAGSGIDVEVAAGGPQYRRVACPACGRVFDARVVRTRARVALVAPVVPVPRHRQAST